jgi:hypothetical protein
MTHCAIIIKRETNKRIRMKKQFNMETFNTWIQDTQDYSMITNKDAYVTRKSNDAITYCTKVLRMIKVDAYIVANNVAIKEGIRLK